MKNSFMKLYLESERLALQVLCEIHAPLTAEFYRRNWQFLSQWEPYVNASFAELSTQQNSLRYEFGQLKQGRFLRYWYALKESPEQLLGNVCFQGILPYPFCRCEIGYKQDAASMGRGYATEAALTAIGHLFGECGIHRIEAMAEGENLASIRLLQRLGFVQEGTARQAIYLRDGWQDCRHYALLNPLQQE